MNPAYQLIELHLNPDANNSSMISYWRWPGRRASTDGSGVYSSRKIAFLWNVAESE
jgi:hypothetical protein